MIRKYHKHSLQTTTLQREEELQNIYSNKTSEMTIKAKQPDLSYSSGRLQNWKGHTVIHTKTKQHSTPKQWEVHKTIVQQQNQRLTMDSILSYRRGDAFYW